MRGRGYVDGLLAAGTATLLEARMREGNEEAPAGRHRCGKRADGGIRARWVGEVRGEA